jgi:hypothetical protein
VRAAEAGQRNGEAAGVHGSEGAFDPEATRAALAGFPRPVLVLAGETDVAGPPRAMGEYAGLFGEAELVCRPGRRTFRGWTMRGGSWGWWRVFCAAESGIVGGV